MSALTRIKIELRKNIYVESQRVWTVTADSDYMEQVIGDAMNAVYRYCNMNRFPDDIGGYIRGGSLNPSTDITGLSNASMEVSVDGNAFTEITLTVSGLNTGDLIAADVQSSIRSLNLDEDDPLYYVYKDVTCLYDITTGYTITSGTSGGFSGVDVAIEGSSVLMKALKFGHYQGSKRVRGTLSITGLEDIATQLSARVILNSSVNVDDDGNNQSDQFLPNEITVLNSYRSLRI